MKHKHLLALLLSLMPSVCYSQRELNDSISFGANKLEGSSMGDAVKPDSISEVKNAETYHFEYTAALHPLFPYNLHQPLDLNIPTLHFTPEQSNLFQWNSGAIVASGSTRSFPGLMQIDIGEIGIFQSAGNFIFRAGGIVNKYGYFNGLNTQYGLNGSISYQFTPKLSATIFGEYYFGQPPRMANGMPMSPALTGFYGRSTFGGYLDYRINERWGVQTGVQTVQQVGTNRYKAEPIVTPYYRINKKVAIGLPVGQILYHVLKK